MLKPLPFNEHYRIKKLDKKLHSLGTLPYIMSKSLKYLDFTPNFISVILIQKKTHHLFKSIMLKHALQEKRDLKDTMRLQAWKYLLVKQPIDYQAITARYEQAKQEKRVNTQAEHHIKLDITRSFNTNNVQSLDKDKLSDIERSLETLLKFYANENTEISYYQGMNMLMAFFYYATKQDQQLAYQFFDSIIDLMLKDTFN